MFPVIAVIVFIVVLFCYVHITAQWKTSNDHEIYETDFQSSAHLQEIVSVKQPVVFKLDPDIVHPFQQKCHHMLQKNDVVDMRVFDVSTMFPVDANNSYSVDWIVLPLSSTRTLLATDTAAKYYSEGNADLVEDFPTMDSMLRGPLTVHANYDLLLGSPHVALPLRYHICPQYYLAVCSGKIRVKLIPPKYAKLVGTQTNYELMEFRSPISPNELWSSSGHSKHDILQRVKILEVELNASQLLFIPPYWWYSIQFSGDKSTVVFTSQYNTLANIAAQSKHWLFFLLQQNNITLSYAKRASPTSIVAALDDANDHNVDAKDDAKDDVDESSDTIIGKENKKKIPEPIVTNAGIYYPTGAP
jgi:hypothetical protein